MVVTGSSFRNISAGWAASNICMFVFLLLLHVRLQDSQSLAWGIVFAPLITCSAGWTILFIFIASAAYEGTLLLKVNLVALFLAN